MELSHFPKPLSKYIQFQYIPHRDVVADAALVKFQPLDLILDHKYTLNLTVSNGLFWLVLSSRNVTASKRYQSKSLLALVIL